MEYSNRKKKAKRGRKPIGIETMLRMYLITFERQGTMGRGSDKCAFIIAQLFCISSGSLIYLREEDRQMENSDLELFPGGKQFLLGENSPGISSRAREIRLRWNRSPDSETDPGKRFF